MHRGQAPRRLSRRSSSGAGECARSPTGGSPTRLDGIFLTELGFGRDSVPQAPCCDEGVCCGLGAKSEICEGQGRAPSRRGLQIAPILVWSRVRESWRHGRLRVGHGHPRLLVAMGRRRSETMSWQAAQTVSGSVPMAQRLVRSGGARRAAACATLGASVCCRAPSRTEQDR